MKVLLYLFLIAGAAYVSVAVVPDTLKDRALAAVGLTDFSVTETIENTAGRVKDNIADTLIPQSPQEQRAEHIERLRRSLAEIRAAQQVYEEAPTPQSEQAVVRALSNTEQALAELEKENNKNEQGAVSSLLYATADGIRKVTRTDNPPMCEVVE